ncbi:MAG: hypothetical protein QM770_19855 [Tepidisphaeraceae bacterium]
MRFASSIAVVTLVGFASVSSAHLASFKNADGYYPQYGTVYGDVTYYNAGANGPNSGGGAAGFVPADTGLWSLQTPVGGVFATAANRAAFTSTYPAYPPTPPNTAPSYMVGGHFPGHLGDNANLAFRNDNPAGTGPARYRYQLDSFDTGGVAPGSVTSGIVTQQFYFVPSVHDPNAGASGGPPGDRFTMSLMDSSGNIGFQWGYTRDDQVVWRKQSFNNWNFTGVYADDAPSNITNAWDGVKFTFDLTNDTFGIDYYDVSTNLWSTMVPTGTAMGTPMSDFSMIDWQLEDDTSGSLYTIAGKNYYDDFSFGFPNVPEPAMGTAALVGLALITRRRRT